MTAKELNGRQRVVYENIHDLGLLPRLGIFGLFFGNGVLLWHLPGIFGLIAGGVLFAFVTMLVLGEAVRQVMLRC